MDAYSLFLTLFYIFAIIAWFTDNLLLIIIALCSLWLSQVFYNPDDIYFPDEKQSASVDDDKLIKEYRLLTLNELPSGTYTSTAFHTPSKAIDDDMQATIKATWTFNNEEQRLHLTRHALITSMGENVLNETFDIKVTYSIEGSVITFGEYEGNAGIIQSDGYPIKALGNNIFLITYFNDSGTPIKEMLTPTTLNNTGDNVTVKMTTSKQ